MAMEEGMREVQQGTEEAAKSGSALQEILDQINAVSMQVNQIATAAEEQRPSAKSRGTSPRSLKWCNARLRAHRIRQ